MTELRLMDLVARPTGVAWEALVWVVLRDLTAWVGSASGARRDREILRLQRRLEHLVEMREHHEAG